MISFGQLESRVRTLFEAESSTRWESDKFLSAANDGLDELSEATLFYERHVNIQLQGKQTYYDLRGYVPDDAVSINNVYYLEEGIWLNPWGYTHLITPRWEKEIGVPQKYVVRGLFWIGLYPRPTGDVGNVRVYYSGIAPHLKHSANILPTDLSDDFVPALEDYMLYDLTSKDGDTDKALGHFASYQGREGELAAFVKDRIVTVRSGRLGRQVKP